MFIKIKLEPQSSKALSPLKKISYFSIDDDATIMNLKIKIESYVDVPAERQEIRSLENVLENNEHVREVCDIRGTAIMLYAYDEHHEFGNPQFVCFLQVYTNELAAEQQELEQRSKLPIANSKHKTSDDSCTSSITLIASSDTDRDSEDTDNETSSSSDFDSGDSTDNTESSFRKKRSKQEKSSILLKKMKVTGSSETPFPETLCQFLDEFPKSTIQMSSSENKYQTANKQISSGRPTANTIANDSSTLKKSSKVEKLTENNLNAMENRQTSGTKFASTDLSKIQSNNVTTTINKKDQNSIHPCHFISPEIRDYLAIIFPSDGNPISRDDFENMLVWFFDRFHAYESSNSLHFDNKTAISLFDGKLWIACENLETFDWISASVAQYHVKPYKILSLNDCEHKCEVVVPIVSDTKNILDVFDLLEKQNKNIITLKWSVKNRQALSVEDKDFIERAVSRFCSNELLTISMDTESKNNLGNLGFKLKYCFWQIVFKFI